MKKFAIVLLAITLMASMAMAKDKPNPVAGTRGALDCSNAIPIGLNESINTNNIDLPNNVEAYSCVGWPELAGEAVFELVLDGEYVVNGLIHGMAEDLDIFFLDGCEEANCLGYGNTLVTTIAGPGTYYFVVDGYNGAEDFFVLTTTCEPVAEPAPAFAGGETCEDAVNIQNAPGTAFSVDLSTYTDEYDSDCFSWNLPGGDAVYAVDLNAGENFSVTMDGPCDISMYIMGDCASGESLACSDNCCSGAQEIINFEATFTGTYYLVLDTFQAAGCEAIVNIDAPVSTDSANWGDVKSMYR